MATLYLLPENTPTQMMAIVLKTSENRLIVIDGGMRGDAQGLLERLRAISGEEVPEIALWILTHCHLDHIGALTQIGETCPGAVKIDILLHKLLSRAFVDEKAPKPDLDLEVSRDMADSIEKNVVFAGKVTPNGGDVMQIDDLTLHFLSVPDETILQNCANNSSLLIRIDSPEKRVMITGDLGEEASEMAVDRYAGTTELRADYCQMAHHGQNGATKRFYEAVSMSACLWPTPLWLWNNDAGGGYNTFIWKTVEVRAWMDDLGVKNHFISHLGMQEIMI